MPELEVVSVFNAAAACVGDETVLLMRVAERPRAVKGPMPAGAMTMELVPEDVVLQPLEPGTMGENLVGVTYLDVAQQPPRVVIAYLRRDQPGIDLADPRSIRFHLPPARPEGLGEVRDCLTYISHLRVARSRDGEHFEVDIAPAVVPANAFEEYGCEDPRATLIEGAWHITYVSVGRIGITTSRLTTKDFVAFERHGVMFLPDHKDVAIFPERIGGRYVALTRPMPQSFNRVLGIWMAYSDDLVHWGGHTPLALPRQHMWDALRTGASCVPFRVSSGRLELYHGVDLDGRYAIGGLLLDAEDPSRVLARSTTPILEPFADYERTGLYNQAVFSCGHVALDVRGDRIRMYYGAADSCIAAADFDVAEILASMNEC